MLKDGQELGRAIREAIRAAGLTSSEAARAFGVKAPSVLGWYRTGRISKPHLAAVMKRTEGKVPIEHWGDLHAAEMLKRLAPCDPAPEESPAPPSAHGELWSLLMGTWGRLSPSGRLRVVNFARELEGQRPAGVDRREVPRATSPPVPSTAPGPPARK